MMRSIVEASVRFRGLVVAAAAAVIVIGVTQLPGAPVDTLPEFKPTVVEVQTEALGLSAEEVEQLITVPLEQDLLNGVAFLSEIESASLPGLSSVVLTFEDGTDLLDARQVVAERLTQAVGVAGLPEVAKPPQMLQPLSSTSRVAIVKLSSDELTPIETSVLARWVIGPRLLGVEGVANVALWGQRERQLQVLVEPERLQRANVTLLQVIRTAGNALEVSPLSYLEASSPGTGGFIDTLNQRLQVFHEQAITSPEELASVTMETEEGDAVFVGGQPLTLGEVTEVVENHQPLIGDALCSDGECMLLVIEKFPGANTVDVASGIDEALDVMQPGLPGLTMDTSIYRPADYIEQSFSNLQVVSVIGAVLLLLALAALTASWRKILVVAAAVAVSLATAGIVLMVQGATFNIIVVAGLVVALVVLVDDAVTDVERAAERAPMPEGVAPWRLVVSALLDNRTGALYAVFMVAAMAVPVFFAGGVAGAFLPPLVLAYLLAMVASFVVALIVTPALSMLLLAGEPARGAPPILRWLQGAYDRMSAALLRRLVPVGLAGIVFVAAGILAVVTLDTSMDPALTERDVLVQMEAAPGTSLTRMSEMVDGVIDDLESLDGVSGVGAHVGRAIMSDQVVNVNSGEAWVGIASDAQYGDTLEAIEGVMDRYPDLSPTVSTYSQERVDDVLRRPSHDIVVRVYGEDPTVLREKADEIEALVSGIDGVVESRVDLAAEEPAIKIQVDLEDARTAAIKPGDARRSAAILVGGITVGNLFEEQKVFDVVVWGAPEIRDSAADVEALLIDTPTGARVRLGAVANVDVVPSPTVIRHESVASYLDVTAEVSGRSVGEVADDVDAAVASVAFPLEHHAELLGNLTGGETSRLAMIALVVACAVLVFLMLQAVLRSWRLATVVFAALPVALAGSALAVLVTGGVIGLGFVAASLAVLVLALRHSIALVRRYQRLEHQAGVIFGDDLVRRGTRERLASIVTSAAAIVAVFAPFALAGGSVGLEVAQPMAVAVIGGVVTTVLLVVVVLPTLYLAFGYVAEPETWADDLLTAPIAELEAVRGMGVGQ